MQQVQLPILNVNRGLITLSSTCYVLTLLCSGNSKTKIRIRIRKPENIRKNKKRPAETGSKCSCKRKRVIRDNGLEQIIEKATRATRDTKTLLDIIKTSHKQKN